MNRHDLEETLRGLPEAEVERRLNGTSGDRLRGELLPMLAGLDTAVPVELGVMSA